MKLSEIANLVGGALSGPDAEISGVSDLDRQTPGTIAYAENKKGLDVLAPSPVAALILTPNLECPGKPVIRSDNPRLAFSKVLEAFSPYKPYPEKIYPGSHIEPTARIGRDVTVLPQAVIMDNAEIGDGCVIYSHVFVGKNVRIGKNCVLKSGVKIDEGTEIGDNAIIHHNAVIGGDGFGYLQIGGRNVKVPQIGRIVIGNDVEIGACVTIDRATIGETLVGAGVKIDNLVQVAHNVKIGDHSVIMSQAGIAGSSTLGKACFLTGQVGIADHVTLGDGVIVLAQSGVESRQVIESGKFVFGTPARDMMEQKRIYSALARLPELVKTVTALKKKIDPDASGQDTHAS